jgi:hypothetical protein
MHFDLEAGDSMFLGNNDIPANSTRNKFQIAVLASTSNCESLNYKSKSIKETDQ